MEIETEKPTREDEQVQVEQAKRVTITPVHTDVQPAFDPDKARQLERTETADTFNFESESTAPAALVAAVPQKKLPPHSHKLIIVAVVLVCVLFVAGLFVLQMYI